MKDAKQKLSGLTAEELFSMARAREQEEAMQRDQESKEKRSELKARRKEIEARHRKELAELDREIQELGGPSPKQRGSVKRRRGGADGGTISQKLCEIVATQSEMTTTEIRDHADATGIDTKNLSQTLAYLKRQGRLESPRRGVYKAA